MNRWMSRAGWFTSGMCAAALIANDAESAVTTFFAGALICGLIGFVNEEWER